MRRLPLHSWREMRFDLRELSGGLGDLGTFVPLAVSLVAITGLDPGTVLVFAGLFNVATGFLFNQPIPVQPMKAIAAVAIAEGLDPGSVAAAGFGAGVFVLVLALTGAVEAVERRVPRAVVRGIQLGIGLKLLASGVGMVQAQGWWGLDSRALAVAAAIGVLITQGRERFPTALALLGVGLGIVALSPPAIPAEVSLGWSGPDWIWPSVTQWRDGLLLGALPQIPLTLLNSVIAVCALSGDLFPGRAVGARAMALSVGAMNVLGCLAGAMPSCHGSGGLAGQYRFGGRTGGSVVMLGLLKIVVGGVFGSVAWFWLDAFPVALLGVLLGFAGIELALPARECRERESFLVAVATAGTILAWNTLVGFGLGMGVALALRRRGAAGG